MKLEEIADLLKLIKGIYGHRFLTEDGTVKAWETYLQPFPAHIVKKAIDEYVCSSNEHPPSAATLIGLSDKIWSRDSGRRHFKIEDKSICKCGSGNGWVYFRDKDGYNVSAKCGACRKIGVRIGHNERELLIPYVHPETFLNMGV